MVLPIVSGMTRSVILSNHAPNNCASLSRNIARFRSTFWCHDNLSTLREMLTTRMTASFNTVVRLFGLQVNSVTAQRIRRMGQLIHMYNTYSEKSVQTLAASFARRFLRGRRRRFYVLCAGALFAWDRDSVTEQELESCASDLSLVKQLLHLHREEDHNANGVTHQNGSCPADVANNNGNHNNGNHRSSIHDNDMSQWEQLISQDHLKMWRKPVPNSHLFQYTVYGSFDDISARAFFLVQLDIEYRKIWDKLVIKLDVIDKDVESGSEVVHWIMHYPFPMYSREYVFVRRHHVDYKNKHMILVSKAVNHPKVPENNSYVRVNTYHSQMVIKPYQSFDKNGFEYVLTYYDDPQTHFPRRCVSYLTSAGIPDFVTKLHMAAKEIQTNPNVNYKVKSLSATDSVSNQSEGISVSNFVQN